MPITLMRGPAYDDYERIMCVRTGLPGARICIFILEEIRGTVGQFVTTAHRKNAG